MRVLLKDTRNNNVVEASISRFRNGEPPLRKNGWKFNWKKLCKIEEAEFYKLSTLATPEVIEGILMLTLVNEEMLVMNNVEVAPHNFGSKGKFDNVAGCLIAFACFKSFELGQNHYLGFLSFESKTQLIDFYVSKYGATFAIGQKMFFDSIAGKALINKYLSIDLF